jgi:HEAT repeat protein
MLRGTNLVRNSSHGCGLDAIPNQLPICNLGALSMKLLTFKSLAVAGLFLGLFGLALTPELEAASKEKDSIKYTNDLKTSKDPKVKATAITELGKLGQIQKSLASEAAPYMIKALEDKDNTVRAAAAKAVGMIDPDPKEAVPPIVKILNGDKVTEVRIAAAQGLAAMGSNAKDAIPDLRKVVKDEDKKSKLGKAAADAIKVIQPKKK